MTRGPQGQWALEFSAGERENCLRGTMASTLGQFTHRHTDAHGRASTEGTEVIIPSADGETESQNGEALCFRPHEAAEPRLKSRCHPEFTVISPKRPPRGDASMPLVTGESGLRGALRGHQEAYMAMSPHEGSGKTLSSILPSHRRGLVVGRS